jgi:hypothetical protein
MDLRGKPVNRCSLDEKNADFQSRLARWNYYSLRTVSDFPPILLTMSERGLPHPIPFAVDRLIAQYDFAQEDPSRRLFYVIRLIYPPDAVRQFARNGWYQIPARKVFDFMGEVDRRRYIDYQPEAGPSRALFCVDLSEAELIPGFGIKGS